MTDLPDYLKGFQPVSRIPESLKGYLDQYTEVREICIRAKWSFDGAKTLTPRDLRRSCAVALPPRGWIGRPG